MVDFTLTDEQKSMRELAHDFAEKEIRPVAWEYDKDGTWPQEINEKAWELGLMSNGVHSRSFARIYQAERWQKVTAVWGRVSNMESRGCSAKSAKWQFNVKLIKSQTDTSATSLTPEAWQTANDQ